MWIKNLDQLPKGWKILLSDLSAGMLIEAQQRLPDNRGQFAFAAIDVQEIPSEPDQFQVVIGNGLVDHVPDRVKALGEIQRVLKLGGIFYTSTGGRTHLQEIEDLVKPFVPQADFGGDPDRFGLENGAKLLLPWFHEIQLYRFEDQLVFKEAEPIIAYVLSEASVKSALAGQKLEEFRRFVEKKLFTERKIVVTSQKGLFAARKGLG